jgi:hypothetical protein
VCLTRKNERGPPKRPSLFPIGGGNPVPKRPRPLDVATDTEA